MCAWTRGNVRWEVRDMRRAMLGHAARPPRASDVWSREQPSVRPSLVHRAAPAAEAPHRKPPQPSKKRNNESMKARPPPGSVLVARLVQTVRLLFLPSAVLATRELLAALRFRRVCLTPPALGAEVE